MPINNITQSVSTIPAPPHRGVDVQTQFVIKQEDFQDHLQGTTVTELNTLKDQLNSRIGEINSTATTMNEYASTASTGASTATTKAGEASTSASGALTSKNQASTFATNSSNSATKASQWADNNYNVLVEAGKYSAKHWATVAENFGGGTAKLTGNQTIAGVKTFSSSPIVPTPMANTEAVNKQYADLKVALVDFTGANQSLGTAGYQKLPGGLIIQWGGMNTGATLSGTITFPISFPMACAVAVSVDYGSAPIDTANVRFNIPSKTNVQWFGQNFSGGNSVVGSWAWIAIGY